MRNCAKRSAGNFSDRAFGCIALSALKLAAGKTVQLRLGVFCKWLSVRCCFTRDIDFCTEMYRFARNSEGSREENGSATDWTDFTDERAQDEVLSRNIRVTAVTPRPSLRAEYRPGHGGFSPHPQVSRLQYVKDRELAFQKLLKNTAVEMIGKCKLFRLSKAGRRVNSSIRRFGPGLHSPNGKT